MRSIWEWFKRPMSRIEGYLATVAVSLGASFLLCMMHAQTLNGPVNSKLDAIMNKLDVMGATQQTNNNQVTVHPGAEAIAADAKRRILESGEFND